MFLKLRRIPKLLDAIDRVDVSQESLLGSFVSLFHSICSGFGKAAILAKVIYFGQCMRKRCRANYNVKYSVWF